MKRALVPIATIAAAIFFVLMVPSASSAEPLPPDPLEIDPSVVIGGSSSSKASGVDVAVSADGEEGIFVTTLNELRDANLPDWAKLDLLVDLGHLAGTDLQGPNPPSFDWGQFSAAELAQRFETTYASSRQGRWM